MRTLFGENILSPSPPSAPTNTSNPFELSFQSSVAAPSTSTGSSSSQGSSVQDNWLTQRYQDEPRDSVEARLSSADGSSTARYDHVRRKGSPKLLFMGMRRSGKSSIQKVIFEKFSPAETLYLDPTTTIETATMESFITFTSAELPFNIPYLSPDFDHESVFGSAGAIIWVLDMQDEYYHSITHLIQTALFLQHHHPRIHFEVFIHKTDGLSDEYKADTFRDVRQRVQDELLDAGYTEQQQQQPSRGVAFYQTSIFDHSVYEAMSKVVQKLLPQLPALEALLNRLCSACRIQKAYLFDTLSKIYIATDASPTFLKDYEVCSDYVDVIVDVKQIYGWRGDEGDAVGESCVTLGNGRGGTMYVYAREVNEYLSLICVMGQGSTAEKRVLIDYNVGIVQGALTQMFQL